MKKVLSIMLSVLLIILAIVPSFAPIVASAASADDAYAVIFTASDFQSSSCYSNLTAMMQSAQKDGITQVPDAFIFGGDYTPNSDDPAIQVPKVTETVQAVYPNYSEDKLVYVQGNHDTASNALTPTGFYEYENFVVYVINEDDFKTGQADRTNYDGTVQTLANNVASKLLELKQSGDTRPVFVATHVPLHHSSRSSYGENIYSKYLFDVLNEYGKYLDIVFLFGHNHSSNYDDYIGGAVNYIAKGEEMRVPIPDVAQMGANGYTEEKLNFTYMNYGYVGYSSNSDSGVSTSTLTMGAFQLCPTTIEISRYTTSGVYTTETIERITPQTTDPYVKITGSESGMQGESEVIYGVASNIENPTYSWSSSDNSVVKVLPAGKNANVIYTGVGSADVTFTVTDKDGKSYSKSITINVTSATKTETIVTPGETITVYKLTNTITAGKKYVIASSNAKGSTRAVSSTVSSNRYLTATSVTVKDATDNANVGTSYIENPASGIIWTAGGSSSAYTFKNGSNYMRYSNSSFRVGTSNSSNTWTYSNNRLKVASSNYYFNYNSSNSRYQLSSSGTNVYFYEETTITTPDKTETITTKAPYEPNVVFNKGTQDINGQTVKFYSVNFGDGFMIDGSFTGFSEKANNITTTWTSSDPSVATVENGYVTFVSSGETTINYVVTDGTTTITKSVDLLVSRAEKPVETFALTNTFEPGKQYIIANTNVAGSTMVMGTPSSETGHSTYNVRMTAYSATIQDVNGVPSIYNTNDMVVWNAVSDTNGNIYLVNEQYAVYLYSNNDLEVGDLGVTTDKTFNGTIWSMNSSGKLVSNDGYGAYYSSSDGNFRASSGTLDKQFVYEKTVTTPIVTLKCDNAYVDGVTQTIYAVTDKTTKTLKGSYANFGEDVTVQWITSNENVATVDENGVVTFKGVDGVVDITYLVTDTEGNTKSATVTFNATTTKEPVRVFKYTTTVEPGKNYVIVSEKSVGAAYLMLNEHYSGSKLKREYAVIQPDSADGNVYVEVAEDNFAPVWVAESTGTDGYYYFKSANDGAYLWADGEAGTVSTTATLSSVDGTLSSWSYNGDFYNQQTSATTGFTTGIRMSSSGYFRVTDITGTSEDETDVYLFEEVELVPYVHIRSKYVNVENTTIVRSNVCPYQTETLMPKPENFDNDAFVTYEWTSSNPSVATIDENGLVTYTGVAGETVITLVAVSTIPNEDGTYDRATNTAKIKVASQKVSASNKYLLTHEFVAGQYYVIASTNTAGEGYVMTNNTYKGSSAYRLTGTLADFEETSSGIRVAVDNLNNVWLCKESDTPGYYYFVSAATEHDDNPDYFTLVADSSLSPDRRVMVSKLDEYNHDAYLISMDETGRISSKMSLAYSSNRLNFNASDMEFRLTTSTATTYVYGQEAGGISAPLTQIRISSFLGTDDLTNRLQYRYNVEANDTEQLLRYTEDFASITKTEWSVSDESVATIDANGLLTYTGKEGYVSVTLKVTGVDSTGEEVVQTVMTTFSVSNDDYESPTNDYPEYPHEGSVHINKTASNTALGYNFQTSGVTEVELSVTGVPLTQAVDVVVVFDHSSSMNSSGRLQSAIEDTRDFALQLVNANRNNRIAIVTFDRYRNNYDSLTDTTNNYTSDSSSNEDRIITGDGTPEGAFVGFNDSESLIAQIDSLAYNSTAGTNYDYGLQEAYRILEAAKKDPKANKMQYVIFMSDGEPYVFNNVKVEYGDADPDGAYEAWLRGDESNATLAGYLADTATYPAAQYFNTRGENWYAEIIKTPEGQTLSDMPDVAYYDGYREGLGTTIFSIGYGAGSPGSLTYDVLTTMASELDNYYYAEGDLQEAYDSILKKIVFAANNAVVTDKMGENFALHFAPSLTLDNGMATIVFDPAPYIEIGSWSLNSESERVEYTAIETITFQTDANGNLTGAYSNLLGDKNIYDSSKNQIVGSKVTYDITSETFTWNIGDITRDEITLKYYAYLEGSAEGEREGGTYYTNEYAYVNYVNYLGNPCSQTFPVPSIGWKDAAINYEFYLVNENGEPVNRDGIVVPFAERVLIGQEKTERLLLNSSGEYSAMTLVAKDRLPLGYTLFNELTSYSVAISSGDNPSQAIINDKADIKTTYFRDGTTVYKGDGVVPNVSDYMNTHVSFAVLNVGGIAPDSVVIDYGLPVKISAIANDINARSGELTAIGTMLVDGTELNNVPYVTSRLLDASNSITLENGTATIEGNQIIYTPSNLTMSTENVFYYEYLTNEGIYLYTTVTVIPAANIYYEESFFTFKDGDGYTWQTVGDALDDKFQAEDRPGTFSFSDIDANNVYGMDHAYDDSYTYSLGSAKYASIDAGSPGKEPTAEFTFSGTGFDFFSVTNSNTGAVLVSVYKPGQTKEYKNFIVQTYYGYSYEVDEEGNGKYVVTPDSEDCLYQVPVISARDLGYDTYRVVIKPMYVPWLDLAGDGSYDIYVDSVRIYDPAGESVTEDSVIGDAYLEDSEFNPHYTELRRTILASNTFYDDIYNLDSTQYSQGSIFIDSIGSLDANGISDKYLEAGPNNEVYLAKGQAIAFHLTSDTELLPTSVELGMKTISGNSSEVALMNTNSLIPRYVTVSGAHEMYRRLQSVIVWDEEVLATTGKYQTKYPIVIVNTSDSLLSLTHLKWAFSSADAEGDVQVVVNSETPAMAYAVARSVMAPFPYTDEDIQMKWSDTTLTEGKEVTLTITTPADIARITLDGVEITDYTMDSNGNKVWTYTFTVTETGENSYDILLFANNGKVSQPMATETITVTEEPTETNIFIQIIEWIKRVIAFFKEVIA